MQCHKVIVATLKGIKEACTLRWSGLEALHSGDVGRLLRRAEGAPGRL
jgi:hypothetical protein